MERKSEAATYTHGHHASVLRSHSWRTASNSAGYLIPHLKPDMNILDIGCGPGTITVDLATLVPQGRVTGLERTGEVLNQARAHAKEKNVTNIDFVEGDANALDYPDGSFDVVMCHQVLQHVQDPVGILREMRRVAKLGGIIAVRESDYGSFVWYPDVEGMEEWRSLYLKVAKSNGGEPNAGRMIHAWAKKAGFQARDIRNSSSTWCYSTKEEIEWWSSLWAERTLLSSFAKTAIDSKLATSADLGRIAETWRKWGEQEDAWFSVLHGEILCRKEERNL
ncbi:hypothetical protein EG329_002486 [Mollisiaceae sp. DMI_Dod_QoI]|nr:hypothetical protein EG329_002486 [Helotiales sp. DMI_Dod_QoI]